MKKLLFALAVVISHSSLSQTIVPFPDSLASWTNIDIFYTFLDPTNPWNNEWTITHMDEFCMNNLDTTISTIQYKQLDDCAGSYLGAIRDSSGVVTYVPKDSTNAFLAYDFNAEQGDTMEIYIYDNNYLMTPAILEVYVTSIDSVNIGDGIYRKSLEMFDTDYSSYLYAISGIGSMSGLFRSVFPNVSNSNVELFCMTENNITLYPSYDQECGNANLDENTLVGIDVYPNPADDYLHIERDSENDEVSIHIYDALGVMVKEELMEGINLEINISDLSRGIYVMRLQKNAQTKTLKIVKD